MKKRFLAVLLGAVVTASVLAGCGGGSAKKESGESESAAAGEMVEGGDFIKGVSTEAPGFDPFTIQTADARSIFFNIYEGLMRTETDGSFAPALAETCEVSDDLQTKLKRMPDDARKKLQETLTRIINEGSGGLICIIL